MTMAIQCQECDTHVKPPHVKLMICGPCSYGIWPDGYKDGLHEGIRRCAVEVNGIMCVNGAPLVEVLAAVNE